MKTPGYQIMVSLVDATKVNQSVKDLEDKVNHAMNDGYEPIGGLSVVVGSNNKMMLMQAVTLPKEITQHNTVQNAVVYTKNIPPKRERLALPKVTARNVV